VYCSLKQSEDVLVDYTICITLRSMI